MNRKHMPTVRESITHRFSIAGHDGYVTAGKFEDGALGEIFILMSKEGSTLSGLLDCFAISISIGLQRGVTLSEYVDKFCHVRFEPSGMTGNPEIPIAKSIIDYVFRWLATQFLSKEEMRSIGIIEQKKIPTVQEYLASPAAAADDEEQVVTETLGEETKKLIKEMNDSINHAPKALFQNQEDAPTCPDCGAIMQRSGSCYLCSQCGRTSGCS